VRKGKGAAGGNKQPDIAGEKEKIPLMPEERLGRMSIDNHKEIDNE